MLIAIRVADACRAALMMSRARWWHHLAPVLMTMAADDGGRSAAAGYLFVWAAPPLALPSLFDCDGGFNPNYAEHSEVILRYCRYSVVNINELSMLRDGCGCDVARF